MTSPETAAVKLENPYSAEFVTRGEETGKAGKVFTEAREKVTREKDDGRDPEGQWLRP